MRISRTPRPPTRRKPAASGVSADALQPELTRSVRLWEEAPMRTLCTAFAAFCAMTSMAWAMEDEVECMAPVAITSELVAQAGQYEFSGYEGSGAIPAFLVGSLSPSRDSDD